MSPAVRGTPFTNSPPLRSSARSRRQRSSAVDTITVKQKESAITIPDSSDPVAASNNHAGDNAASNRPWGRKGKAPVKVHSASQAAPANSDSEGDITEYEFREEDYDMGTDEDDVFSDNESVISVESSDDGDEYPLSDRPWREFPERIRKQWELMFCMVCIRRVHENWEMTELYQIKKDAEMLLYMQDYPLPQWLIPQEEAQQAYQRLTERRRWRDLGIPIYGQHPTGREPDNIQQARLPQQPTRHAPSQHLPVRSPSSDAPKKASQLQTQDPKNVPRSSVAQQGLPRQTTPQQTTPQQTALQQGGPPQTLPQQDGVQQNAPQQSDPPQITSQAQQNIPQQNVPVPVPPPMPPHFPQHQSQNSTVPVPNSQPSMGPPPIQYPVQHGMQGPAPHGMYFPPPGIHWGPPPHPQYGPPHPQQGHQMHSLPFPANAYSHPGMGMGYPTGPPPGSYYHNYQPQQNYKYAEPAKRRTKKETPPPQSPPPPPQTPPYAARKRPIEKKPGNKPGRKSTRKHAEAEEFPWTRKIDFKEEKTKATWDLNVYDKSTLDDMAATRAKNIAVIEDIDAKIQEQQRIARAAKKAKEKAGNPSEIDGKKVRQKREGRPKGDVGGDPYHSGVFAFASPEDQERAAHMGFTSPDEVIDHAEEGKVEPEVQASIKIYWDPGKKGMTENLEQAKFSVRDTVVTRKQLENTPILTKVAAECIVDFCPDLLWRSMLLRITSEAGCGNKDVRDRFCHNGCYCDKATITKRISAALGQKQTQPKSKGYQPGEWEWYDENVKDFSKYIDYFGMRTSHRNMLKIQMAGEKRKRDHHTGGGSGEGEESKENDDQEDKRQKLVDIAAAPPTKVEVETETEVEVEAEAVVETSSGHNDIEAGNESAEDSDDSNAVSLQDSDVLDKMED